MRKRVRQSPCISVTDFDSPKVTQSFSSTPSPLTPRAFSSIPSDFDGPISMKSRSQIQQSTMSNESGSPTSPQVSLSSHEVSVEPELQSPVNPYLFRTIASCSSYQDSSLLDTSPTTQVPLQVKHPSPPSTPPKQGIPNFSIQLPFLAELRSRRKSATPELSTPSIPRVSRKGANMSKVSRSQEGSEIADIAARRKSLTPEISNKESSTFDHRIKSTTPECKPTIPTRSSLISEDGNSFAPMEQFNTPIVPQPGHTEARNRLVLFIVNAFRYSILY